MTTAANDAPALASAFRWGVLAAATGAAAALRFPYLGNQSLWYDETFTRAIATAPALGDVWHAIKATEATPPLYYLLTWAWAKLFGIDSDSALRATSAVASVACVPAAFVAVRRFVGEQAALATAALVAVSPMLVWYALDARAYSLLVLACLLSLWATALVLERPSRRRWLAWAVAGATAVWTHYFAGFLLAAEICVLVWRLPEVRPRTLGACAVVAALIAPLAPLFAAQSDPRTDHIGTLSLLSRVEQSVRQFGMGPNVPRTALEAAGLVLAVGALAAGLALARRSPRLRTLAVLTVVAIAVPLALSVTKVADRFFARNMLIAWAGVAAIAAVGLLRLRAVPLAAYVVICVSAIVWVEADWRYQNADWHGATRALRSRAGGHPLVVYPAFDAPVAAVYLRRSIVPGSLRAADLWVIVEPARINRRDLQPRPAVPRFPVGFVVTTELSYHGFKLVELRRPRPVLIARGQFGADVLGSAPALLPP